MLGRAILRNFPRAGGFAPKLAPKMNMNLGANFAQRRNMILGGGKPISLRQDSLVVACAIAVIVHYGPQDLAAVTLILMNVKSNSNQINYKTKVADPDAEFAKWQEARGIEGAYLAGSGSCRQALFELNW